MKKQDVNIEDYLTYDSTAHNLGWNRVKGVEDIVLLSVKEQVIQIKIKEVEAQLEALREDAGIVDQAICNINEYLKLDLPVHVQIDGSHYCIHESLKVSELNSVNT